MMGSKIHVYLLFFLAIFCFAASSQTAAIEPLDKDPSPVNVVALHTDTTSRLSDEGTSVEHGSLVHSYVFNQLIKR